MYSTCQPITKPVMKKKSNIMVLFVHYNVHSMGHLSSFPAELAFPLMLSLLGM